jgi:hypothetical protein
MKTGLSLLALAIAAISGVTLGGCMVEATVADQPPPSSEIVVQEAPPAPQAEVITVQPSANHVWMGGYWSRRGSSWHWVRGAWVVRPHANAIWVGGRWESRSGAWVWVPGHWRNG